MLNYNNYYLFKMGCTEPERPACFSLFLWLTTRPVSIFCPLSTVQCPLHSALRTNLFSSAARIFADRWFSVIKAQISSVLSSLFGSPLLSRSKIMIYVFMSSLLYLNRKKFIKIPSSLSYCRFWLITRFTINIIYLIVFHREPCRWVFVTLGANFASKICLNNNN